MIKYFYCYKKRWIGVRFVCFVVCFLCNMFRCQLCCLKVSVLCFIRCISSVSSLLMMRQIILVVLNIIMLQVCLYSSWLWFIIFISVMVQVREVFLKISIILLEQDDSVCLKVYGSRIVRVFFLFIFSVLQDCYCLLGIVWMVL